MLYVKSCIVWKGVLEISYCFRVSVKSYLNTAVCAQGSGHDAAMEKLKQVYWMILKLNWTVWSVVQYITVNYIPLKVW